ncbi:MAG: hypothetical protein IRZ08_10860 [Frankia sp.]|nr:hypothetical protein [Frankia sp.]
MLTRRSCTLPGTASWRPAAQAGWHCPAAGGTRMFRAVVGGGTSASLAIAAHVAGGAAPPPPWLVLVTTLLLVRLAHGFAGRPHGLPAVLAAVGCAQAGAHLAFVLGAHPASAHGHVLTPAELVAVGSGGLAMSAAHAAAAGLTAVALHRADRLLWLAAALRAALPRLAAQIADRLATAVATLRLWLAAMTAAAAGCLAAEVASVGWHGGAPPIRPRTLPLGPAARRRGPPLPRLAAVPPPA